MAPRHPEVHLVGRPAAWRREVHSVVVVVDEAGLEPVVAYLPDQPVALGVVSRPRDQAVVVLGPAAVVVVLEPAVVVVVVVLGPVVVVAALPVVVAALLVASVAGLAVSVALVPVAEPDSVVDLADLLLPDEAQQPLVDAYG